MIRNVLVCVLRLSLPNTDGKILCEQDIILIVDIFFSNDRWMIRVTQTMAVVLAQVVKRAVVQELPDHNVGEILALQRNQQQVRALDCFV